MKILICPDKFKGSLTAVEVCRAIEQGLRNSKLDDQIELHPMADGGDGSLDVLSNHFSLNRQELVTVDPLGRSITTYYYYKDDMAFIELASASGLILLAKEERNPMHTNTFGTGVLIQNALKKGCRNIYLMIGGSATNDAGTGILSALGCIFLNKEGQSISPNGANLTMISEIVIPPQLSQIDISFHLLCDVSNPLFGQNGAAFVYGPQKGASDDELCILDDGLRHISEIIYKTNQVDVANLPGAGAAGGIAACMVGLLNARIESGFDALSRITGLEGKIKASDIIISGEGRLDHQSFYGKVVGRISDLCKIHNKPLTIIAGSNELNPSQIVQLKLAQVHSLMSMCKNEKEAMEDAFHHLVRLSEELRF